MLGDVDRGRDAVFHYALIYDFVEYRYLTPTAGNRKLTNIQAAHPHAKIV